VVLVLLVEEDVDDPIELETRSEPVASERLDRRRRRTRP
jgi:hypothetical protein